MHFTRNYSNYICPCFLVDVIAKCIQPIANKVALMVSDLNLFAMASGHVCADVMLASRDGWEDGSDVVRLNDELHTI